MAQYTVYDIATSETFQLTPRNTNNGQSLAELKENDWPFLMYAKFGPRGHAIVMVYKYDIFYTNSIKALQTYRVTNTGVPGIVYNGVTDWLYEGLWKELENTPLKYSTLILNGEMTFHELASY